MKELQVTENFHIPVTEWLLKQLGNRPTISECGKTVRTIKQTVDRPRFFLSVLNTLNEGYPQRLQSILQALHFCLEALE